MSYELKFCQKNKKKSSDTDLLQYTEQKNKLCYSLHFKGKTQRFKIEQLGKVEEKLA